ncbi:hypothetical protein HHL11_19455 [Ramlibacter sp. G-1-2-2]|uniref:Uncharacterized protein n=1 Tax=Ramlibacter agri TaxID=2728837 RepID=A0A848H562_9BURK|nr:hypothetical protein [Ramlibacter agri]NML45935.1 hypothetical protein [Ramlibacter agri]
MIQTHEQGHARQALSDDERRLFYTASILTPEEVAERTEQYPEKVRCVVTGNWFLCGDLSEQMFDLVKADWPGDLSIRVTAFASPIGVYYGVLSHQAKGHAHRFVLPLYEPSAGELLKAIQQTPLMFMLGRDEEVEAMVLPCPLPTRDFAPLLALCSQPAREQLRDAVAELPNVISVLKEPAQVPTAIHGREVTHVDVSVLLPTQSLKTVLGLAKGPEQ